MLHAPDRDAHGLAGADQHGLHHRAVLLGADDGLALEDEHRNRAVVPRQDLVDAAAALLEHLDRAGGERLVEEHEGFAHVAVDQQRPYFERVGSLRLGDAQPPEPEREPGIGP